MMVTTHNLGFPSAASKLQQNDKQSSSTLVQQQEGSEFISVACSGVKDPMVTMMDLLGHRSEVKHTKAYQEAQWFGSEVKCVVPEFTQHTSFTLDSAALIKEVELAKTQGLNPKPVIIGPVSYLWFSEAKGDVNKLDQLELLLTVYADLLADLFAAGVEWVQFDEPVLAQQLNEDWKHAILQAYFHLHRSPVKKLLASYFGKLGDNLALLRELTVDGVHLDTISAEDEALKVADWLPHYKIISLAVVDGSSSKATDIPDTLAWLQPIHEILGDRLWLAPSCCLSRLTKEDALQKFVEIQQLAIALADAEPLMCNQNAA